MPFPCPTCAGARNPECVTCRGAGYIATPETFELNLVRNLRLHLARKSVGLDVFLNHENAEYVMNEKRQAVLPDWTSSRRARYRSTEGAEHPGQLVGRNTGLTGRPSRKRSA